MNLINQVDVLTALNNLMGRRTLPGGEQDDLKRYCQFAFDYAWRYYKWGFSLRTATLVDDGNGVFYLPADFDLEGHRQFVSLTEVPLFEILTSTSASVVAVEYDPDENRYFLNPGSAARLVYQRTPPTLGTDEAGSAPFPSAMTVGMGAAIYAKQAENPTRADISQEWDEFHAELDRHVARSNNTAPRSRARNFHDRAGTFTGDVGA